VHLDYIPTQADGPWPRIDPRGWVSERRYNQRDLAPSVDDFLQARERSIAWLKALPSPDWQAAVTAPFGQITAGDVFASWVAHDLMHIRQLVRLHFAHTVRTIQPYKVNYAGDWTL
jgi:DinB superfamily